MPLQVGSQLRQEAGEQIGEAVVAVRQVDLRLRAGVVEQAFERAQHRPPRFVPDGGGLGAEAQLPAALAAMIDGHASTPSKETTG